jgi:hypothetical protein
VPRPVLVPLLCVLACAPPPPPAPDGLAENLRWFWLHAETADEGVLLEGLSVLSAAARADTRSAPLKGQLPLRLGPADVVAERGGSPGVDPAGARGLLLLNPLRCTLLQAAPLLASADQQLLHPGLYDAYVRTFDAGAGPADFAEGRVDRLRWTAEWDAHFPPADGYHATQPGTLRRVGGRLLLGRRWLSGPARFAEGSTSQFPQDYQLELFWERAPGELFHALAAWRELRIGGLGLTTEDDAVFAPMLERLVELDGELERACNGG